jgi:hypothetical protein
VRLRSLILLAFACLLFAPGASAASAPQDLHAFLLGVNETPPAGRNYSRTPSFAWNRVTGANSYEFQISSSRNFSENGIVWERDDLVSPVTTVPVTLPWMTGSPYSFYARVRAVINGNATGWSDRHGFNVKSPAAPNTLSSGLNATPGLVRWTPVSGATAYQVTFLYDLATGEKKIIKTATTAADLREYYTLHNLFPTLSSPFWRVRAVREVDGPTLNRLPAVSYGPWSAYVTTVEPAFDYTAQITPLGAVSRSGTSDTLSTPPNPGPEAHELTPGFWWSGGRGVNGLGACSALILSLEVTCPLYHVYVYSDEDCVNRVHASDLVGSPAYAPRLTDPLKLPADPDGLNKMFTDGGGIVPDTYFMLGDGEEGKIFDGGGEKVFAAGTDPDLPAPTIETPPGKKADRRSGLWDNDWPEGNYYWTVVPAVPRITPDALVEYQDVDFGEDMCQANFFGAFGKTSAPAIERASGVPFASGLTASGQVHSASNNSPAFYGRIVVAWKPAAGANRYQVQWSRKANPFKAAGSAKTVSTSVLLNLPDGVWYYRVRGIDTSIPGTMQGMTWSDPQFVRALARKFTVLKRPR